VCDSAFGQRHAAGERHDVLDVSSAHHSSAVDRDICKQAGLIHILLSEGIDEIVIRQSGNGDYGGAIALRIVETVQ
jgi:hypothetical protein